MNLVLTHVIKRSAKICCKCLRSLGLGTWARGNKKTHKYKYFLIKAKNPEVCINLIKKKRNEI